MKVVVFFAAICIVALVMPQAYAEEDESAVRETRAAKGVCLHVYIILRNCLPKHFFNRIYCQQCIPNVIHNNNCTFEIRDEGAVWVMMSQTLSSRIKKKHLSVYNFTMIIFPICVLIINRGMHLCTMLETTRLQC